MQSPPHDQVSFSGTVEASQLPLGTFLSSRPKPRPGWQNQDRAKIDLLDKEISANQLREAYLKAAQQTAELSGGSTGTTMIVTPSMIHVAWLGDSPAFLVGVDSKTKNIKQVVGLNEPHIPLYDENRIKSNGGYVEEGRLVRPGATETSLSMSRSFGDSWLGETLVRQPDLITIERKELSSSLTWYGVVGSDGVIMDSEYNLLFPRKDGTQIIDHVAKLFGDLLKEFRAEQEDWADIITAKAQEKLQELHDKTPEPRRFDDAVVDDTSLAIILLSQKTDHPAYSYIATVTDGHRDGGEITAQKAIAIIHETLTNT